MSLEEKELKPAVFLDRDGTINEEVGYLNHPSRLWLLPTSAEAIRLLNRYNVLTIVVSNQAGVARGYFSETVVKETNQRLLHLLKEKGARIDALYYCPHHPEGKVEEYRLDCDCRKPRTGMFEKATSELPIDRNRSYVIGDKYTDIVFARNVGIKGVLVLTGYGRGEWENNSNGWKHQPDFVAVNLLEAVLWILEDLKILRGERK